MSLSIRNMYVIVASLLSILPSVGAVEVCKVADLRLVTQTGEFFLAGAYFLPRENRNEKSKSSERTAFFWQ